MEDKENIEVMKEYLGYAFRMEQNVYFLKKSIAALSYEYAAVTRRLDNSKAIYSRDFDYINNTTVQGERDKAVGAEKAKLKKSIKLILLFVAIVVAFVIIAVIGYFTDSDILFGIGFIGAGFLVSISPIGMLLVYFLGYRVYKRATVGKVQSAKTSAELQRASASVSVLKPQIEADECLITVYTVQTKTLGQDLKKAKEDLELLYSKNLLPERYRNLVAVGAMYGYLVNRICNTIDGHGGIFDRLETDLNFTRLYQRLDIIIEQNRQMLANQREVISALNRIDSGVASLTNEIKQFRYDYQICESAKAVRESQINEHLSYVRWNQTH